MGYLTIDGELLCYNEYKEHIEKYKIMGLMEFLEIYESHKGKFRARHDLHWGEEIEYTLFYFDTTT
jgi:hypothetical protein